MGDAISPSSYTTLDLDLMDDLLMGGCWLETNQSPDIFEQENSTSAPNLDSSCLPLTELNNTCTNANRPQNIEQEDQQRSLVPVGSLSEQFRTENFIRTQSLGRDAIETAHSLGQLEPFIAIGGRNLDELRKFSPSSEMSRRVWIEPRANPSPLSSVRERLMQALNFIKESTKNSDVLVQIWLPVRKEGRLFLSTSDEPFTLDSRSQRLLNYRYASMKYHFPAEENSNEAVGLPGRVFLGKLPEWTPDVQFFSSEEYPRINHAQRNDVRGTLALPVFEQGNRMCVGVVEVVLTTQRVNYRSDLDSICGALQAVNLRSSEVVSVRDLKVGNNSYQVAIPEIQDVLRAVCETHSLPLAQTWVPCMQQGKKGSRHSDETYPICVSTVDVACYIKNPQMLGFHEACSEHHLLIGQGLAGKAFTTNQPCFSPDITAFNKAHYPLIHYAHMFGLCSAVAIRLRSIYTGTADFVLEFFLPTSCRDSEEQKLMLNSLSMVIQQVCRTLRVVTEKELEDESVVLVNHRVSTGDIQIRSSGDDGRLNQVKNPTEENNSNSVRAQMKGKSPLIDSITSECQKGMEGLPVGAQWNQPERLLDGGEIFSELEQHHQNSLKDGITISCGDSFIGKQSVSNAGKVIEKRRTKTEKKISLQVLRQYFAGSLKDAAKSIGVCPTTLKRICRQHGITRWPSRKIKKVGHSLKKLQVVIDSVQGVEGAFQISSLYNFPHAYGSNLNSPKPSGNNPWPAHKQTDGLQSSNMNPEGSICIHTAMTKSPTSSCSQSSSSSLSCSAGKQKHSHACQLVVTEATSLAENESGVLKSAYSEAELQALVKDEQKAPTHSLHKSFSEHQTCERSQSPVTTSSHELPRDGSSLRVKVTYGDDKVRFSLQPSWGFQDLQQEVAKRFNLDCVSAFDIKYLDDDSEWVLLTCDDDLEECKDIYRLSHCETIKLSVHHIAHRIAKSSLGSSGPS